MPNKTVTEMRVIDKLLAPDSHGDVTRFGCGREAKYAPLPKEEALELSGSELFDPEATTDDSPAAEWFVTFTQRFKGRCWLIGYRVGDEREDRGIVIEGILIAYADLSRAASILLTSKRPDECACYPPGPNNSLDVPVVRYWWD